ncbi:hypothetical protein AB0N23_20915 [Streptomyces sp. NPDC052644]
MLGLWFGWILLLGPTVVVTPVAAVSLYLHWRMRLKGVPVEAVCDTTRRGNGWWSCSYRYVDGAGKSYYSYSQRTYPLPLPEPGQSISIVYDPKRPDRTRTASELRRPVPWAGLNIGTYLFSQLVCGLVGGAILAGAMAATR